MTEHTIAFDCSPTLPVSASKGHSDATRMQEAMLATIVERPADLRLGSRRWSRRSAFDVDARFGLPDLSACVRPAKGRDPATVKLRATYYDTDDAPDRAGRCLAAYRRGDDGAPGP